MDCDRRQRRICRKLHDVCHDLLFDAAGFPMADPAGVDPDSLAADLGALQDAIGCNSLDDVSELLQRISSDKESTIPGGKFLMDLHFSEGGPLIESFDNLR
jgi:hypothetical protein